MKVAVCNSVGIDADGYAMIHSPSRWTNSTKDHNIFTYYPWQLAYCSSILQVIRVMSRAVSRFIFIPV